MLILNFSHPLTAAHLEQIEALTGQNVEQPMLCFDERPRQGVEDYETSSRDEAGGVKKILFTYLDAFVVDHPALKRELDRG